MIDQLRYYLVKEVSLGNDGNISMENLKCINNDSNNYEIYVREFFLLLKKIVKIKFQKQKVRNS